MTEYHKINSIFKRDMTKPKKPFIVGEYSDPAIEYLKDNQWEWTEKVDGTNILVMAKSGVIYCEGKTDNAQIPNHLYARLREIFSLTDGCGAKLLDAFNNDVCLYGEGFGYKIQGKVGIDYLKDQTDFYLFDIKIGDYWLEREKVIEIGKLLGITVPVVVGYGTIDEAIRLVSGGFMSAFGTAEAEGLVLRPVVQMFDRKGNRIITKIKYRDFN